MNLLIVSFHLLLAALLAHESDAAFPLIAGFEPSSDVTDLLRFDLDQRAMETQITRLNNDGFVNGKRIYANGGNSNSFAVLSLTAPLTTAIAAGTPVTGLNGAGGAVSGVTLDNAAPGASTLRVVYNVGSSILPCAVGGLTATNTTGCLAASGNVNVASSNLAYSYNVTAGNQNGRSMRRLILDLNIKARVNESGTGAFYPDFQKFVNYYGITDYTDKIVNGGFDATVVTLNSRVFDLSAYDFDPSQQIVKKTVHYQLYPQYVLRSLEVALEKCSSSQKAESLRALDEAVAYYTGSQEGEAAAGTGSGSLLHFHARRRCGGTRTCGASGDQATGNAKVNIVVFENFTAMKASLDTANCAAARINKENIAKIMFVPFIQGAMRYGYLQSPPGPSKNPVAEAEGATFAMAVLPFVHSCNAAAATTIYNEMRPNSGNTVDFTAVKAAFESVFQCMGVKCADVGGYWDSGTSRYLSGTEPCVDAAPTPIPPPTAAPVRAPTVPVPTETPVLAPTPAPIIRTGAPARRPGLFRRIWNFFLNLFGF